MHRADPETVLRLPLRGTELASVTSLTDVEAVAARLAERDGTPGAVPSVFGLELVVPAAAVARTLEALVRAELGAERAVVLDLRAVGERLAAAAGRP